MASRTHKTKDRGIYQVDPSRIYPKGAWEVRYRDANKRTRRKTFRTQKEAQDFRATIRTDIRRGDWIDPTLARTSFRDVAEGWYTKPRPDRPWKPKTRQGYRHTLDRYLLPAFGDRPIGGITADDLADFLADLPDHLSPTSKRAIYRSLSPVFQHALSRQMVRYNPVSLVKAPPANKPEMLALSREQVAMLADEISPEYRTMVQFMAQAGPRAGEVAALQVKDLDPLRRKVMIRRSLADVNVEFSGTGTRTVFGPPKNGKPRTFIVSPSLMEMLVAQVAGKGPDDLVFTGPQGGPIRWGNWRKRHFNPAIARLTSETTNEDGTTQTPRWPRDLAALRIHDLRHTCVSLLIQAGVHIKAIQEQLGHSTPMVTMNVYAHWMTPDTVANAMEKIFADDEPESPSGATVTPIR